MRRCLVALCLLASVTQSNAQDFETPTLRGTSPFIPVAPKYTRWDGFYAGGHVGLGLASMDFRNAFDSTNIFDPNNTLTAPLGHVSWAQLGQKNVRGTVFGGFAGYNTQFDDAVVGVEFNYNATSLFGSSTATRCWAEAVVGCLPAITLGDGNDYNVNVTATSWARISGYGTLRGRAGWAYGSFLPYATAGITVARVEVSRSATADATPTPTSAGTAFVHTETDRLTRFTWGYSLGGGVDFLIMPNVVRACRI